jgi:tRNA(fMet)-specific endonuclease VapC
MRFLVDTDIVSYALTGHARVIDHLRRYRYADIAISAITEAEMRYGAEKRGHVRIHAAVDRFLQPFEIVEFSTAHVPAYARLRTSIERRGHRIGDNDMFIAAQAIALDLVLVTNNEREFRRVPGLKIENWAA